jgi:hypothetical protein
MTDTYYVRLLANDLATAAAVRESFPDTNVVEASHASGLDDALTIVIASTKTLLAIIGYLFDRKKPVKSIKITRSRIDTIEVDCAGLTEEEIKKTINDHIGPRLR